MKKIKKYSLLFLFLLISMYSTNNWINMMKEKDPIMKQIKESEEKYNITPVNAEIKEDYIIPGIYGISVDEKESYHNMKQYGIYNEAMTVLKEEEPELSISNQYDKYISSGNQSKRQISFVFKVENNITNIQKVLKKEDIEVTIFIDGNLLTDNSSWIIKNNNQEFEILSFQNKYNSSFLKASKDYLESITNKKTKYCYTEENNTRLLKYCAKQKLHTIKPKYIIKTNLYKTIKNNLENASIYSIELNAETEKEYTSIIKYIKSKGYEFVSLEELLKE